MNIGFSESETIEFKESISELEDIGKSIVSFANAWGGQIYVGVKDNGELIKTTFNESSFQKINSLNQNFDPKLNGCISVQIENIHNFDIMKISVSKSLYLAHAYKGVSYIRQGTSDLKMTPAQIAERHNNSTKFDWSAQVNENTSLEWLDQEAILFLKSKYLQISNEKDQNITEIQLLNSLSLINEDGKPNNTCLLFLGKKELTEKLFGDRNKIIWIYKDELNNIEERLELDSQGIPMIFAIPLVLDRINKFNTTLQDIDLFRNDISQYDNKVTEEILINAIAHRDWSINMSIEIIQTATNLEIRNPGLFRADLDDVLLYNKRPDYLNQKLVDFLKKVKLMEKEGGGLKKSYYIQIKKGLSIIPRFHEKDSSPRVDFILTGRVVDIEFARFMFSTTSLTQDQVVILDKIRQGKNTFQRNITNDEYEKVKDFVVKTGQGGISLKIKDHLLKKSKKYISDFSSTHTSKKTSEEIILDYAKKNQEFSTDEIYNLLNGRTKEWVRVLLKDMVDSRKLKRIKRGLYCYNNLTN